MCVLSLSLLASVEGLLTLPHSQDIQLSLRTSIRHLRLSRASPAPLLDPNFANLSNSSTDGSGVGVGGVARAESLKPLSLEEPKWRGEKDDVKVASTKLSVAAMGLEKEAWEALGAALEKRA